MGHLRCSDPGSHLPCDNLGQPTRQACRLLWEEAPEEVQESHVALKAMAALPPSSGLDR